MSIEAIPIQGLLRGILRRLPGFLLRWHYPARKLAGLIYVDIRPRHDSAIVDLGSAASFTLYLQVINFSPFSMELDRANFRFGCGGVGLNAVILEKKTIAPGEITVLYIQEAIPDGYANTIAKMHGNNPVTLSGNIEFNCNVRSFAKGVGHLDGINPKIFNPQLRATT